MDIKGFRQPTNPFYPSHDNETRRMKLRSNGKRYVTWSLVGFRWKGNGGLGVMFEGNDGFGVGSICGFDGSFKKHM